MRGKRKQNEGGAEHGKLHRLTMNLEFDGAKPENFNTVSFQAIIDSAIRRVLGQAAPNYQVHSFEPGNMRGSLVMDGKDLHLIWAALSVYGKHFEQKIAFHIYSIHSESE